MSHQPRLEEFWSETLRRDLSGFADPRTDVLLEAKGAALVAMWTQRGRIRNETFQLTQDRDFRWLEPQTKTLLTYREFLCSESMADFGQLTSATIREFSATKHYVDAQAVVERNGASEGTSSRELLLTKTSEALRVSPGKTQMFFLKGDAGAGKTTLLREVTRQQAEHYRNGTSDFLFLYLSAQGRALSNLRDALSGELDDLRAAFTRDAVPPLVRQGLVVPIIDGFDELLGAAGYGDAFGSLHQFLDQLAGFGGLIVSARSSFYDVEFVGRELLDATRTSAYDVVPITMRPWGEGEILRYLSLVRESTTVSEEDRIAIAKLPQRDRELLAKPFFASLFPDYVDAPDGRSSGASLVEFLVESYIRRESQKIVDRDGRPLLDVPGHRRIFTLAAELMWSDEKRGFSADDLRTVAELVADERRLAGDSATQLVNKITSYAGFRTARQGLEQRFQFEHEVYFDHFLSEAIRTQVTNGGDLASLLNGGFLAEEVAQSVVDEDNASQWLDNLHSQRRAGATQENLRRNAGSIVAACFRLQKSIENRTIASCQFVNTSFGDSTLKEVAFRSCRFVGARLDAARFDKCEFSDCVAESLVFSSRSRLDIKGLVPGDNLYCIIDVANGQEVFSPTEMRVLLRNAGMTTLAGDAPGISYSAKAQRLIGLLQRLLRKYRQSNLLCLEDDNLSRLFQDPEWELLYELLRIHHIVKEETRPASGARKTFLRYQLPLTELMAMEKQVNLPPGSRGDFWRAVRELNSG